MAKQVRIRIYPGGKIESETIGIKGKSCIEEIKKIEDLTGAQTVKSEFTAEYYEKESRTTSEDVTNRGYQFGGN